MNFLRSASLIICFGLLLTGCIDSYDRAAEQRYVNSLTPEQFARYDAQKQQALGMFLSHGGFQSFRPLPSYQSPIQPVPRPLYCYGNTAGTQTMTTCY